MAVEPGEWERIIEANPDHSRWYIQRFRDLEAAGDDIVGEARLIDAMLPRGSRVLDAGCGPGRVGGYLQRVGHAVVGVDVDPELIAAARQDHPGATWIAANLADLDLAAHDLPKPEGAEHEGAAARFDAIVCAGNVMTFLAPSTRVDVLRTFERHLDLDGRAVVGFGAGRGYAFEDFFADAATAGLALDLSLATWDLRPFTDTSDFLVAVLRRG
ncbi:SAM-dependent methyltransferase [Kineosphaera limosa]|uniref:Putative methyltransferase n=1 Tax=Kineosphaera limosa NBRC 100340 TaxID=1184609 RepID=K6X8Q4_9MICO|nr:class I SAM-dependent methyltransferase [Kineosphaera limosa]NYE01452.1 SAM-dependent methyltransferase [Kineosphaera limosa]GAB95199.1 putative methyltransferase [Kineosphaera limosa NBRC 100340]